MTFSRDEQLMQLELDRAILYGESCMLEYDIQVAKLQESGLLTESSLESLQYLLEAAASESGFGGVLSKIKEVFTNLFKRFKDKNEQQRFGSNVNKLNTLLKSGAISVDDAIDMCASPSEIENLGKSVQNVINQLMPKFDNGTITSAELEILNKAMKDLEEFKTNSGITLGEDQQETTQVAKEIADRGYNGIVGRAEKIYSNVSGNIEHLNDTARRLLGDFGVSTTKKEGGGKIVDANGNEAKNRQKVEVNKTGEEIGKDLASKVTGTGKVLTATELSAKRKERGEVETKYNAAKAKYERVSNGGKNTGSGVEAAKKEMDELKSKLDKLDKLIRDNGKSATAKAEEKIDEDIATKGKNASVANINEYREAHKQFLRYLEIYAMLEGKYALECDKALQSLTETERNAAIKKYTNDSLASIDKRISDAEKRLKKLTSGTKEYDDLAAEIEDLKTHRQRAANKLTTTDSSTKSMLDAQREKVNAAQSRAEEAEEDLRRSNDDIRTTADNRAKRDASLRGRIVDGAKTTVNNLARKFFGDPEKRKENAYLKQRKKYWKGKGKNDEEAERLAQSDLRAKKVESE